MRAEIASRRMAAVSQWVDDSYPSDIDPELAMRRRTGKVGNEYGEMLDAIEAWTGENPRKGVTGTVNEVLKELLDVAVAALGAVEHLTGNRGESLAMLDAKIDYVCTRAGLQVQP